MSENLWGDIILDENSSSYISRHNANQNILFPLSILKHIIYFDKDLL